MDGSFAKDLYSDILQSPSVELDELDRGLIAQGADPGDSWYDDGSSCEDNVHKLNNTTDREWEKIRNQFLTIGYRDGLLTGKENAAQEGFNFGFKESVFVGYNLGLVRGITRAMACLPSRLKEELVETEETRNKFQCLHESMQSLSRSDALKLFHEDLIRKSGNQNESADPNCATVDSDHLSPDVSAFDNYYKQLQSVIDESPLIDAHLGKQ